MKLQPRGRTRKPHRPIDGFFESLAADQRERAIGVVLSGTATDGTLGLEAIKAEGGITFAQDDSAKHESMPRSAVAAGCVDLVLAPAKIAQELARIAKHPYGVGQPLELSMRAEEDRAEATAHENDRTALPSGGRPMRSGATRARAEAERGRGKSADNGYKKSCCCCATIGRRFFAVQIDHDSAPHRPAPGVASRKHCKTMPTSCAATSRARCALLGRVISVTSFFRNPECSTLYSARSSQAAEAARDDPIRAWVLGCSTGQEAYSLAMRSSKPRKRRRGCAGLRYSPPT